MTAEPHDDIDDIVDWQMSRRPSAWHICQKCWHSWTTDQPLTVCPKCGQPE